MASGQVTRGGSLAARPASTMTWAAMIAAKPSSHGPSALARAADVTATSEQPASHITSSIQASS